MKFIFILVSESAGEFDSCTVLANEGPQAIQIATNATGHFDWRIKGVINIELSQPKLISTSLSNYQLNKGRSK